MRVSLTGFLALLLLSACSTTRREERFYAKTLKKEIGNSPVFARSFTGFTLLDPATGRTVCDLQGDHYFTPASTTKILTMATCLAVLGDSVPAFDYAYFGDSLVFRDRADPTFLNSYFNYWQTGFNFLRWSPARKIYHVTRNRIESFGPGWAWDDYQYSYSTRRKNFPLYGGLVKITAVKADSLGIAPAYFEKILYRNPEADSGYFQVGEDQMGIWYSSKTIFPKEFERSSPINWKGNSVDDVLGDTLKRRVINGYRFSNFNAWRTFYSSPLDTVLRRMMYQSDNFIAEQMLIVCNGLKYDTLAQDKIIQWAKDTLFAPLLTDNQYSNDQPPRWVDGSGLSRYNLITPRYFAGVLSKLWKEQNHERLLNLFPTAGAPETTLDWWQPVPDQPWLFAKSGSMSGVQCMSGYLRTKRGKWLIFSFMNNNFVGSGKPWRLEMRRILERIAGLPDLQG